MALGHLLVDAPLDRIFGVTLGDDVGHRLFDLGDDLALLRARRRALQGRVLEDEPLQAAEAVGKVLRAHQLQRVDLPGAQDELVLAEHGDQHVVECADVAA